MFEDRFQLAFAAGTHVLLFHCARQQHIPEMPSGKVMPKSWLKPEFRAPYRIILNSPGAREVVHEADALVLEQRPVFKQAKERLEEGLDGPIGSAGTKIGGVPRWAQPPFYPRCPCGAPMGFIMQVPAVGLPGWKTKRRSSLSFAGGLNGFVFACTAQSNPYAAMLVVQR